MAHNILSKTNRDEMQLIKYKHLSALNYTLAKYKINKQTAQSTWKIINDVVNQTATNDKTTTTTTVSRLCGICPGQPG